MDKDQFGMVWNPLGRGGGGGKLGEGANWWGAGITGGGGMLTGRGCGVPLGRWF